MNGMEYGTNLCRQENEIMRLKIEIAHIYY